MQAAFGGIDGDGEFAAASEDKLHADGVQAANRIDFDPLGAAFYGFNSLEEPVRDAAGRENKDVRTVQGNNVRRTDVIDDVLLRARRDETRVLNGDPDLIGRGAGDGLCPRHFVRQSGSG